MTVSSSEFIASNTNYKKCPVPDKPEYAFIGRSNVGKSSLINMLCGKKGLAKISATPGKTQLINHFVINKEWYLVDLPGYGYAKVAKTEKAKWEKMIRDYILHRTNLMTVFVLVDSRIPPQKIDLEFMNWLGENSVPFSIAFTKADKLTKNKLLASINLFNNELSKTWEELPPQFITSAETATGKEQVLNYIGETKKIFRKST